MLKVQLVIQWWDWGSIDELTLKVLNIEAAHGDGGCQWA